MGRRDLEHQAVHTQVEVKDLGVTVKDSKSDRDLKFQCKAVKIQDATGLNEFDVRARFDAAEADIVANNAANVAAASGAQTTADNEKVRAQAAEAGLQSNLDAEVARAGAAEAAIIATASAMDVAYKAADSALDLKIDNESAAQTVSLNQEIVDRGVAVAGLQTQITNILSASADDLDSFAEIVQYVDNLDSAQGGVLAGLIADVNLLRAEVDQLLNL